MSSLLVVNRVHRLEIQSVVLVLLASFVNHCPSLTFSLVSSPSPPPLPYVNKYTVYCTRVQYSVRRGGYGVKGGEGVTDR
jgi:hypothetical protein